MATRILLFSIVSILACSILPVSVVADDASVVADDASARAVTVPRTAGELLDRIEPWVAIVEVRRTKDVEGGPERGVPLPPDARDYFKRPDGPVTGLLVDPRGYVLTSYYNVAGTLEGVSIRLGDGRSRPAKVIATSKMDDLAMIRTDDEIAGAERGDWRDVPWSDAPIVSGRAVFAVGLPLGSAGGMTITQGIVSAAGRNGDRSFQTDAKLNYGNTGGPLLDLDARIIGLAGFVGHTYPQWGLNSGVGFASASATIRKILPDLIAGTDIEAPRAPFLGVVSAAEDLRIKGAKIASVVAESSAGRAGIQEQDIIVEIEGREVQSFRQLRRLLFDYGVGDRIKVVVLRGEERIELELELGERPRDL